MRTQVSQLGRSVVAVRCASSFTQADLPPCSFKPAKYTGIASDKLMEMRKAHLHPAIFHYYKSPLHVTQGHMQYLFDEKGNRYVDFLGGIVTVSVGHCHPKVLSALEGQAKKLWHTSSIYNYESLITYVNKLASKFPKPLQYVYLVNSGSEANDLAMLMARLYTGSQDIVSLRNAYHGISPNLMPLAAMNSWRHNIPPAPGHHHAINPDPYRGPWGGKNCRNSPIQANRECDCAEGQCKACDAYVNDVEDLLRCCCHKTKMGGFIAESIQGAGGTVQFPRNYLKRVYEMVRARGGVCIADEVQTGFGRTGEAFWGWQTHGVVPDIVTMAKGIGNGFPLAAVVTTKEVAMPLSQALHFNTFGGNAMACAVGKAVIEVIEEEGMQENCRVIGTYIMKKIEKMQKKYPCIGDVRGLGLMLAVEMVSDPVARTPLAPEKSAALMEKMREKWVLVGKAGIFGNVLRFKPPMCINKTDADYVLDVFEACIRELKL